MESQASIHRMKLVLLRVVLLTTLAASVGAASAQSPSGAVLSVEFLACKEDGTVATSLKWSPADARWLDVSTSSGFEHWSNVRVTPGQSKHLWLGLSKSTTYYARVSSPASSGGWSRSNTVTFTTPSCHLPISPNAATNLTVGGQVCDRGKAHVSFTWTRYVSDQWYNQWFDLSRDPNFSGWRGTNVGIGAVAFSNVKFEPDTTYYVRVSTNVGGGVWWRSGVVQFHTLACPS
jgi:hypothetical protein